MTCEALWKTAAHIERDHSVKQLISVTVLFCIKGVTVLQSSGMRRRHIQPSVSGISPTVAHLKYILCSMYLCIYSFSVEQQRNIRVTLIARFSHPTKAASTPRAPHHTDPAGATSLYPSLAFSPPSPTLSAALSFPAALPPLFCLTFIPSSAEGAAPGEHYFQKASSCIIVRIRALISWTIWQTAYAPSSLNALHLLIKWMSHCLQSNPLNLCASLCLGLMSHTRLFMLQRLYWSFKWMINATHLTPALSLSPYEEEGAVYVIQYCNYYQPMALILLEKGPLTFLTGTHCTVCTFFTAPKCQNS